MEIAYAASGYFGGWAGQEDTAKLSLNFLNVSSASLGNVTIGAPTASDRGGQTGYLPDQTSGLVPAGTRRIEVILTFEKAAGGGDNDASADNLTLMLTVQGLQP